jgi:hypothetical protein
MVLIVVVQLLQQNLFLLKQLRHAVAAADAACSINCKLWGKLLFMAGFMSECVKGVK